MVAYYGPYKKLKATTSYGPGSFSTGLNRNEEIDHEPVGGQWDPTGWTDDMVRAAGNR